MAVLGKARLNTSRSEFTEFVSGKKPETQARYWREYNRHWAAEFKQEGRSPPARTSPRPSGYSPRKTSTGEETKAVFQKQGDGNRYAIVVKAEYTRGRKKEIRHYSIVKGDTVLTDDDIEQVITSLEKDYNIGGARVNLSLVQTIDRLNPTQSRMAFN